VRGPSFTVANRDKKAKCNLAHRPIEISKISNLRAPTQIVCANREAHACGLAAASCIQILGIAPAFIRPPSRTPSRTPYPATSFLPFAAAASLLPFAAASRRNYGDKGMSKRMVEPRARMKREWNEENRQKLENEWEAGDDSRKAQLWPKRFLYESS